jgi:hypothetical protein
MPKPKKDERNRSLLKPYRGDKNVFSTKKAGAVKRVKPFAGLKKHEKGKIRTEINRLFRRENKKKSTILILLQDTFGLNRIESQNLFVYAVNSKWRKSRK